MQQVHMLRTKKFQIANPVLEPNEKEITAILLHFRLTQHLFVNHSPSNQASISQLIFGASPRVSREHRVILFRANKDGTWSSWIIAD